MLVVSVSTTSYAWILLSASLETRKHYLGYYYYPLLLMLPIVAAWEPVREHEVDSVLPDLITNALVEKQNGSVPVRQLALYD